MVKSVYIFLSLFFVFAVTNSVKASHIVGGDISYQHISGDSFKIQLVLYIDCRNGSPAAIILDTNAVIGVFDASNTLIKTLDELRSGPVRIRSVNYDCVIPPTGACVDQYIYTYYTTLPPIVGGYTLAFQRCCRNNSIINLVSPSNVGSTYWTHIPDTALTGYNTSAVFDSLPPNFICVNRPFTYKHTASDPDGDSLVYELYTPYDGADVTISLPRPPAAPPYAAIPWSASYDITDMMGGNPKLSIDAQTGILTVTPSTVGQFVVGILVKEFRNGVYISATRRDFQFNVMNCTFQVVSAFTPSILSCSDTVSFTNQSSGATSYLWDFGVPLITDDTSTLKNPKYTFPGEGEYNVKLISYVNNCSDTILSKVVIVDNRGPFAIPDSIICKGDSIQLGLIDTNNRYSYKWTPTTYLNNSSIHNPIAKPLLSTKYYVTRNYLGCIEKDSIIVTILDIIASTTNVLSCTDTAHFTNNSTGATTYLWDFGIPNLTTDTSRQQKPTYIYPGDGSYTATLVSFNGRCRDTTTSNVIIVDNRAPFANPADTICTGDSVQLTLLDTISRYSYLWTPSSYLNDPSVPNPIAKPPSSIEYAVTRSYLGCAKTDSVKIIIPTLKADFDYLINEKCEDAEIVFTNKSAHTSLYTWNINNSLVSTLKNPTLLFPYNKITRVELISSDGHCFDSVAKELSIKSADTLNFIPNVFTPNGDGVNDCFMISNNLGITECAKMLIYNRWGSLVFNSELDGFCWDGKYKGTEVSEGVYFYIITFKGKTFHGTVTLFRQ